MFQYNILVNDADQLWDGSRGESEICKPLDWKKFEHQSQVYDLSCTFAEVKFCGAAVNLAVKIPKYVSRAGLKLEAALDAFNVSVSGKTALDCGISTGGFTDCLLKRDAAQVEYFDFLQNSTVEGVVSTAICPCCIVCMLLHLPKKSQGRG